MRNYCDVGSHETAKGEDVFRCNHCARSLCKAHWGNPDALPGDMVACIDHVQEVAREEARLQAMRTRHNGNLDALCSRYVGYISLPSEEDIKRPTAIQIGQTVLHHPEITMLTPQQALSLRDWLIQESDRLERLAKEQPA